MKFLDKIKSFLASRIVEEEKKMTTDEELEYISERLRILSEEKDISVLHLSLSGNKHTCIIKGTMGSISASLEQASKESLHFKAVLASLDLAGSTTIREIKKSPVENLINNAESVTDEDIDDFIKNMIEKEKSGNSGPEKNSNE